MLTRSASAPRRVAVAIGPEVPGTDFRFRVHSAFRSALNLSVAGRRILVTLTDLEADDYPQSIRLSTRERFDRWPLMAETCGRRSGDTLVFDDPRRNELPTIDLSSATVAARSAPPDLDPRDDSCWAAWREYAACLEEQQELKGADLRLVTLLGAARPRTLLETRLADGARDLAEAIRLGSPAAAGRAASGLIGLGTGATPSGDDFLCGLIAALWCASRAESSERRFLVEWGSALSVRLDSTNAISATFLECAIAGSFSGALSNLATSLERGRAEPARSDPRDAMARLCALGHSSGVDTATGFLFGLWLRGPGCVALATSAHVHSRAVHEETRQYAP